MKLPDIISMELFQQYLAETFPEDGKHGAVHKLDSTVDAGWKTLMVLGKLPHVRKWLRETKLLVSIKAVQPACTNFTIRPGYKPFSQLIIVHPVCKPFGQFINSSSCLWFINRLAHL